MYSPSAWAPEYKKFLFNYLQMKNKQVSGIRFEILSFSKAELKIKKIGDALAFHTICTGIFFSI